MTEKYFDPRLADRVFELAWTHSQILLRQLNASEADAQHLGMGGCGHRDARAASRGSPARLFVNAIRSGYRFEGVPAVTKR